MGGFVNDISVNGEGSPLSGQRPDALENPARAYWVAAVLALVYTFNFLDRQFLSVLAQPVKVDLHLSDTELGLLTGLAFAIFYTLFGIPVAALSDRTRRVQVIAVACTLWSLFSAACGLATGFFSLALARIGVGVGEAGGSPPAYSIISDYFPASRRGQALAIYALGVPFGTMFGAASGGWIAAHYGWRSAFFVVGGCGMLLVPLLLFTVREPPRGVFDPPRRPGEGASGSPPALAGTIALFVSTPKLLWTALSAGFTSFVGYGLLNWVPSFLIREKGMTLEELALFYSLVLGISSGLGTWASGFLVDRLGARRPWAYALVPGVAILLALPFFWGLLKAPDWRTALVLLAPPAVLSIAYLAPALAVVQNTVRSDRRAAAGALLLFVLNLIGLGGGPLYVGFVSDKLKAAGVPHALTGALFALTPFFVVAFACQVVAAWHLHKDRRSAL